MTVPAERIQYYTVHRHRDNFGCKEKDQDWEDFPGLLQYLFVSPMNFGKNLHWMMMSWSLKNIRIHFPVFPALYSLRSVQTVFHCCRATSFSLINKIPRPCCDRRHRCQRCHLLPDYHPSNKQTGDSCWDPSL